MRNLARSVALLLAISFIFTQVSSATLAAGSTSSDTDPGQVKTKSSNGALYLTTDTNTAANTDNNMQVTANNNTTSPQRSPVTGETIREPAGFSNDLGSYLNSIISITMVICLLLVFYYFISAGLQWITSGGDKSKTEEARNKIVNAIVGIIIVSASFALVTFVAYVLGFESFNDALGTVRRINPA